MCLYVTTGGGQIGAEFFKRKCAFNFRKLRKANRFVLFVAPLTNQIVVETFVLIIPRRVWHFETEPQFNKTLQTQG